LTVNLRIDAPSGPSPRSSNAFGVRGWTARTSGSRVTEPTAIASAGVAACSVSDLR
jgi:hypothetical protein